MITSTSQPPPAASPSSPQTAATVPLFSPPIMFSHMHSGPAAMPGPRSPNAPVFSDKPNEPIAEFLYDYEILATSCSLTDQQKVECALRYIPHSLRDFWMSLDGYGTKDWNTFRSSLENLYPDLDAATRYTRQVLMDFVDLSSRTRMREEKDFVQYYRTFLTISNPLLRVKQISDYDRNAEFFQGFHPVDREALVIRLFAMNPYHPVHEPYKFDDVYEVARGYFSNTQFHRPLQRRLRDDPADRDCDNNLCHDTPATTRDNYERNFQRQPTQAGNTRELIDIIDKMQGLSIREPGYAALYAHCAHLFPHVAQTLAKPDTSPVAPGPVAYQAHQTSSWSQPSVGGSQPVPASSSPASSFFRRMPKIDGCLFCAQPGHMLRSCPIAEKYVNASKAIIINDRMHLPSGERIPNDGSGWGLKYAIDCWLSANSA